MSYHRFGPPRHPAVYKGLGEPVYNLKDLDPTTDPLIDPNPSRFRDLGGRDQRWTPDPEPGFDPDSPQPQQGVPSGSGEAEAQRVLLLHLFQQLNSFIPSVKALIYDRECLKREKDALILFIKSQFGATVYFDKAGKLWQKGKASEDGGFE